MEELFRTIYELIINIVSSSTIWGPVFACLLIACESIIPILPLFVFITVVFIKFGMFFGFILSWIFTVLGCLLSYIIVKYISDKALKVNPQKLQKLTTRINKITFPELVILIAIPFTPAFLVNIAAGISKMPFKKFLLAIIIGKISLVIFWGFVGTSLLDSLKDPIIMIKIVILVLIAYIVSVIINKKLKIT